MEEEEEYDEEVITTLGWIHEGIYEVPERWSPNFIYLVFKAVISAFYVHIWRVARSYRLLLVIWSREKTGQKKTLLFNQSESNTQKS